MFIDASSGDHGYDNEYRPFFAASPLYPADLSTLSAIGGTSLSKAANARGWSERVWNEPSLQVGTGSGCSTFASKPSWQKDKGCAGRMDNDVAAVAAVETPVSVYASAEGGWTIVGGTSASSPLIAGIVAHESESVRSLGAQAFYEGLTPLFDVTEGSNGTCTPPASARVLLYRRGRLRRTHRTRHARRRRGAADGDEGRTTRRAGHRRHGRDASPGHI